VALVAALAAARTAGAAKLPLPGIRTPSGNIECLVVAGGPELLLCAIRRSSYADALQARCMRPDGSGVDWHGFALRPTGRGEINCTGGILYDNGRYRPVYATLRYGSSWHRGGFACSSRVTGLTCRNATHHGIFLSRRTWRTW
jgi:uncharacterized protein DUF6636